MLQRHDGEGGPGASASTPQPATLLPLTGRARTGSLGVKGANTGSAIIGLGRHAGLPGASYRPRQRTSNSLRRTRCLRCPAVACRRRRLHLHSLPASAGRESRASRTGRAGCVSRRGTCAPACSGVRLLRRRRHGAPRHRQVYVSRPGHATAPPSCALHGRARLPRWASLAYR